MTAGAVAIITAALIALGCAANPAPLPSRSSVVALIDGNGQRICGAVAVGRSTLLTARHCLRGGSFARYVTPELWETTVKGAYWAEVAREDAGRDLAWLRTQGPALAWRVTRAPVYGERVYAEGAVEDWRKTPGLVGLPIRVRQIPDAVFIDPTGPDEFWTATVSGQPGWSGSPLVGTDGAVVGIFTACERMYTWGGVENGRVQRERCRPNYALFSPILAPAP